MPFIVTVLCLLLASPLLAQPRVVNGELREAPTGALTRATLDQFAARSGTAWFTYAVPLAEGDRHICDGNFDDGSAARRPGLPPGQPPVMMLEGPRRVWILFRVDEGRVDRIRLASEDCTLDVGGLTVHWANNVSPDASVTLLSSFLTAGTERRTADGALTALAMHREPAALERLLVAARDGATAHLRGQALFLLAQRAGEQAIGAITAAIANDPETDVKRRAVFALSQLPRDEGVPRLIELARTNSNPVVRKQAMFWLGQSRDPRALKFFEEILFK
jgi:hypothetical protein